MEFKVINGEYNNLIDNQDLLDDYYGNELTVKEIREKYGISPMAWRGFIADLNSNNLPVRTGHHLKNKEKTLTQQICALEKEEVRLDKANSDKEAVLAWVSDVYSRVGVIGSAISVIYLMM